MNNNSSSQKEEYLDIVDSSGNVIGQESRKVLHSDPQKTHMAVNILIVNGKGEVLVQQRSYAKKFGGGLWEVSAGGHVNAGEKPADAARRELFEELGIKVNLKLIAKKLFRYEKQSELVYLFSGKYEGQFSYDRNEIEELEWIKLDELEGFLRRKNNTLSNLQQWIGEIGTHKKFIFQSD